MSLTSKVLSERDKNNTSHGVNETAMEHTKNI